MNYLKLRALIIGVTVVALLVSIGALVVGLFLPSGAWDLQGASGLASIIPAFAGVLIAAFALYSYNKLEDADYVKARQLVTTRAELIAQLRLAAYSVATAIKFEHGIMEAQATNMRAEYDASGKFRSTANGETYSAQNPINAEKLINSHAAIVARQASNLQLKATLNHLEPKIVESMTLLTPLVLHHYGDQPEKTRNWLVNFQAIVYGCQAFDQSEQRKTGLANIIRGSKLVIELAKDPFFGSSTQVYKALTKGDGTADAPQSVVEILDDLDNQFQQMSASRSQPETSPPHQ